MLLQEIFCIGSGSRSIKCVEYDSVYDSEYNSVYDLDFVFYDEEENFDDEASYDYTSYDEEEQQEDLVLEEIPFVYCPSKNEYGEA